MQEVMKKVRVFMRRCAKYVPWMVSTTSDVLGVYRKASAKLSDISEMNMRDAEKLQETIAEYKAKHGSVINEIARAEATRLEIAKVIG